MTSAQATAQDNSDSILWDVIEEHLDEAEFLTESWVTDASSPLFTFVELRDGPEERLRAHLDGLVVGGRPVLDEVLTPMLSDEDADPWRCAAACLAMLEHSSRQVSDALFCSLEELSDAGREGVAIALSMSARPDINVRLTDALKRETDASTRAVLVRVGASRGIAPGNLVDDEIKDGEGAVRGGAACMLGFGDRRYVGWVEHLLAVPDPEVSRPAVRSGLVMGSQNAWQVAGKWGLAAAPDPEAMRWLAMFAPPAIVGRLVQRLEDEESRPAALWALGFSGRTQAAEACLPWLADEAVGRLAGEAFAAITGLPLDEDEYWDDPVDEDEEDEDEEDEDEEDEGADDADGDAESEEAGASEDESDANGGAGEPATPPEDPDDPLAALPELEEDLEDDLSLAAEEGLRIPKPEAIVAWWEANKGRFSDKLRFVGGRPIDNASVAQALRTQPTRRRHGLAFEMLVRTQGKCYVPTHAFTAAQEPIIDQLEALPRVDGNRPFSAIG